MWFFLFSHTVLFLLKKWSPAKIYISNRLCRQLLVCSDITGFQNNFGTCCLLQLYIATAEMVSLWVSVMRFCLKTSHHIHQRTSLTIAYVISKHDKHNSIARINWAKQFSFTLPQHCDVKFHQGCSPKTRKERKTKMKKKFTFIALSLFCINITQKDITW